MGAEGKRGAGVGEEGGWGWVGGWERGGSNTVVVRQVGDWALVLYWKRERKGGEKGSLDWRVTESWF